MWLRSAVFAVPVVAAQIVVTQVHTELDWLLHEFNAATLPDSFEPLQVREVGRSRSRVLADPLKLRGEIWPEPAAYQAPTAFTQD